MIVVGLISGTSVDAIDAALVEIARTGDMLEVAVRAFVMQPFDPAVRDRVRALLPPNGGSTAEVCEVNMLLGEAFAQATIEVAVRGGVPLDAIDLVASHGQTVYHQIAPGSVRSTLQIGAAAVIAERTGRTVVADFRPRDMTADGEGAPLVSYLDTLLFTDKPAYRTFQNIGGIGNLTYLPAGGDVLAFDTGPGNVLIDESVRLLTGGRLAYDHDGRMAAVGTVDEQLLAEWLSHPFFRQPPPKSTGREQWGPSEAQRYIAAARGRGLSSNDTIATLTGFTAHTIADAYRRFLGRVDEALIGGGGARNPTLMRMLQEALSATRVRAMDDVGLSADAKEAVAFALMGYATLHGWPGNVPAATGAAHPVVLGNITPGSNYRTLLQDVLVSPPEPPACAVLTAPSAPADAPERTG